MSTDTQAESNNRLQVLLVGDADRAEFTAARDELTASAAVTFAPNVPDALATVRADRCRPNVVVFAQAIPGEFSREAVESLRRAAPLARFVALLGTWCEGEMRTGDPAPGVLRLYWYQWHPKAIIHLKALAEGRPTSWALPATATHEDRVLADSPPPLEGKKPGGKEPPYRGRVAVFSPRPEMAGWICDAFDGPEWDVIPVDFRRVREFLEVDPKSRPALSGHVDLLIYDATEFDDTEAARFPRVHDLVGAKDSVVLCDFPRLADRRRAAGAGAACMLAKPVDVDDLVYVVGQLVPPGRFPPEKAAV